MNRFLFFLSLYVIICGKIHSQIVLITDSEDKRPVSDVALLSRSGTVLVYTNNSGKADISELKDEEEICFQHFSYERICMSFNKIKEADFNITLSRKVFSVGEFVVSANRWEQDKRTVPSKITSIVPATASIREAQTAADLIASSDEVFVQKSQLGGGSPMIRGFATNRVLIVVDGVRLNNAIYREGNIQNIISLDPLSIESAEVIFGPGAVVYGSDAVGGVMDFHTRKAVLSQGEKSYIKGDALTRYSSANKEKTTHLSFSAGKKRIAFMSSVSYSDFDDLMMGSRKNPDYRRDEYVKFFNGKDSIFTNPDPDLQVSSGYRQLNTMNKLRFRLSDRIIIDLANHYSALSNVPRYDRLIQYRSGKLRYGDWYYGPQVWMMNHLQAEITSPRGAFDELRITAARQDYRESRHERALGKNSLSEQFEVLKIYSVNTDLEKKFAEGKHQVYYGFEFVNNDIKSNANTRDIISGIEIQSGSRYPNGKNKYNSFSAYGAFRTALSEKIIFNSGLRYNFVSLNSTIADNSWYNFPFTSISIANSAVSGSLGLVLHPLKGSQLNLNVSTGFRAPNLDDAGKVFDSAPGIVVVPNPDLNPEYATSFELGFIQDLGSLIHFEISGFYTWLKNAMVRHDFLFNGEDSIIYGGELSKVEAIVNAGYARVYGFSAGMELKLLRSLSLKSTINVTKGNEKGGIPLRHATPLFGATHLIYDRKYFTVDLYALYNGPKKFSNMPPSEISKPYMYASDENGNPWSPGWFTLNLKTSIDFAKWGTINCGLENIFDLRYRPYASGIVSPGRNFIISLRVKV